MAWNHRLPTDNDNWKDFITSLVQKLIATLSNFSGSLIKAGTVPRDRLQKPGSEFFLYIPLPAALVGASQTNICRRTLGPTTDGTSVTRRITSIQFIADNITKGTGNTLVISSGTSYAARSALHTIDLNNASLGTGDAEPYESYNNTIGLSWPSGQTLYFDYTYGASAGNYDTPLLVIKGEVQHCDPAA